MIKNYTSSVPAKNSVQYIENKLVVSGARQIMKKYDADNKLSSICFIINIEGNEIPFKLPARMEQCKNILRSQRKKHTADSEKRVIEQAERTAWKLLSDWVDIQVSLIELGQVELLEIFLPYAYDVVQDKTYFEKMKEKKYKGLLEASK